MQAKGFYQLHYIFHISFTKQYTNETALLTKYWKYFTFDPLLNYSYNIFTYFATHKLFAFLTDFSENCNNLVRTFALVVAENLSATF